MKIILSEAELEATRSRGPGGQNVNRTNSTALLRWNLWQSQAFNYEQKQRIFAKLESQLTTQGDLIIRSSESRDLDMNRKRVIEKLEAVLRQALFIPKKRIATRPTKSSVRKRVTEKRLKSQTKETRRKVQDSD